MSEPATATPTVATLPARTTPSAQKSLIVRMAERFSVDADKLKTTLKATAFRQRADRGGNVREVTDEELMALLIIAEIYGLNPFTKELYAYFDPKSGAIIPVVSVDGWLRIINDQPTLQSMSFTYSPETVTHKGKTCHQWIEVEIVRSDRTKPIVIREYFAEVVRSVDFATPWDTHPNRMHRHKTVIQGGRYAFGFGGIYDDDEAQRIIEGSASTATEPGLDDLNKSLTGAKPAALPHQPGETIPAIIGESQREPEHAEQTGQQEGAAAAGPKSAEVAKSQEAKPAPKASAKSKAPTHADVSAALAAAEKAKSVEKLDLAADMIRGVESEGQRAELDTEARRIRKALTDGDVPQ